MEDAKTSVFREVFTFGQFSYGLSANEARFASRFPPQETGPLPGELIVPGLYSLWLARWAVVDTGYVESVLVLMFATTFVPMFVLMWQKRRALETSSLFRVLRKEARWLLGGAATVTFDSETVQSSDILALGRTHRMKGSGKASVAPYAQLYMVTRSRVVALEEDYEGSDTIGQFERLGQSLTLALGRPCPVVLLSGSGKVGFGLWQKLFAIGPFFLGCLVLVATASPDRTHFVTDRAVYSPHIIFAGLLLWGLSPAFRTNIRDAADQRANIWIGETAESASSVGHEQACGRGRESARVKADSTNRFIAVTVSVLAACLLWGIAPLLRVSALGHAFRDRPVQAAHAGLSGPVVLEGEIVGPPDRRSRSGVLSAAWVAEETEFFRSSRSSTGVHTVFEGGETSGLRLVSPGSDDQTGLAILEGAIRAVESGDLASGVIAVRFHPTIDSVGASGARTEAVLRPREHVTIAACVENNIIRPCPGFGADILTASSPEDTLKALVQEATKRVWVVSIFSAVISGVAWLVAGLMSLVGLWMSGRADFWAWIL